jgi:hypothetical protein
LGILGAALETPANQAPDNTGQVKTHCKYHQGRDQTWQKSQEINDKLLEN